MEKRTSLFENGLIWFGAGVSIAEIVTGTYLAPLGFGKGLAAPEAFVNGVRLVPVGDDELVLKLPEGGVDDEAGVLHPAGVEGLRIEGPVPLHKYAVAGVVAAAHDEVGRDGLPAVGGLADEDAPAHVGVAGNQGLDVVDAIDVHRCLLKFY